jgi:hypothetical protein
MNVGLYELATVLVIALMIWLTVMALLRIVRR